MSLLSKRISAFVKRSVLESKKEFVPKHITAVDDDVKLLENFISSSQKLLILTGAGISTESGIPDYRSEDVGLYARSNHRPVQYSDFLKSAQVRQRYWARNFIGWSKFSQSKPNITHHILQLLEAAGKISAVVTQNVDGLHHKAGSRNVIELHGTAYRVICLSCGDSYDRHYIQKKMIDQNSDIGHYSTDIIRPDGDVEIPQDKIENFKPPFCERCDGILKPDIVFFGDNVPKSRVDAVREHVTESDSLLVLGSSLTVFSGYRILLQANEEKKRIGIVNIGPTRADKLANLKISTRCGDILPKIFTL